MCIRPIVASLIAALALVGASGINAATPQASGLILYRSPPSQTREPATVHLWTTDGQGKNAHEILAVKPTSQSDQLRGAYLVPDGVILATGDRKDGNNTDIGLLKRGAKRVQPLFVVRGLYWFQPSPDGQQIAYSRSLPIAGKPLFVIARRDGTVTHVLAQRTEPIFNWSLDSRHLFSFCPTTLHRRLCSYVATTGTHTPTNLNLDGASSTPSVAPSGTRVAFYDEVGPAGERIYTAAGAFLRNLVGHAATAAIWSPDESQLLLQPQFGRPSVFSFTTRRVTPFAHRGPANLLVLDWR